MTIKIKEELYKIDFEYNKLIEEKDAFADMAGKQQKILDLCPSGMPDGTGIFTPESWIKWAKKELGY